MDELTPSDAEMKVLKCRPYQAHLEEIAVKKNTIIHLPTGSGKTFIAIRLIARFRDALLKPWGQGGKRTFFLVNTVPLVNQQRKAIQKLCPVKSVGGYSSEDKVDYWNKQKWDEELSQHEVIVMTCQILSDMLTHQYIRLEDINLLIFDECHHAVDDHPMRLVMKHFEDCPVADHPRVLGLTATLLNANVSLSKVQDTLKGLETTFHATIATVNELGEVLSYSTNPNEVIVCYAVPVKPPAAEQAAVILHKLICKVTEVVLPKVDYNPNLKLQKWQLDITKDGKKIVKGVKNMIEDMIVFINDLGVYGGALAILSYIILLERLKRRALSKEESLLYTIAITYSLKARKILLHSMENDYGYNKILKHSSPQILKLIDILKEYRPEVYTRPNVKLEINHSKKPLSAIIFTKQRSTAKILYNLLKEIQQVNPEEFSFLKHDFIVGLNVNPFKCSREDYFAKKASQKALLKFANKELNCLIATSVIEEGVDIPQCMLVLRYDPPLEYRSYIQSKGRARSSESTFVILLKMGELPKFKKQYSAFRDTEKYIQRLLIGKTDERAAPTQEDIREALYDEDDIPPYITPQGGRLSSVSAISLLNRYCSILPHDQFTVITPIWVLEKKQNLKLETMYKVIIIMPIACPVKEEIVGDLMTNLKSAKRSAALKACIRLHQEGELHPDTLLPIEHGTVDFDQTDIKYCFPNWPDDEDEHDSLSLPKPGTKKRIRKHKKVFPRYLNGQKLSATPQKFYLHVIKLKTAFKEPTDSRELALYKLLQKEEGYGLLTMQQLPKICDFPMFLKVGEVTTSIQMNHACIPLDATVFELVKQFHFFVFDQVLEVVKKFLTFNGQVNAIYAVPVVPDKVNSGYDIDWDTIQTYREIRPVIIPSHSERKNIHVSPEEYNFSVVSPWYREILQPGRYIVSNVLEYMTPKSKFGSDPYDSYEDYYMKRYNLEILASKDQPLLEVCNIRSKMNCLLPRAPTLRELTDKQRKMISATEEDDNRKGFAEILIPEYCIKYDFPGVLWYKALMLPSILHRVYMLLVANELRLEILMSTRYGKATLSSEENWQPIKNDKYVAIKSLLSQVEEPSAVNSIDRINNPIDGESSRPNIMSMQENVYQLQKKKISNEYPWDEKTEPIDIERNITTVTVVDIECYDEFVSAPLVDPSVAGASPLRTAPRPNPSAAILPPPLNYNDKIELLERTPTGRGPELCDILTALTTIKSHDGFNLERAETLGDSFLKFAASLYLFHKFPKLNEGQLTNIKGRLIGNRNLYYAGAKIRLGGRMKIEQFSPRKDFMLPGFSVPDKIRDFLIKKQIRPTFLIGVVFPEEEALSGQLSSESWANVERRFRECDGAAEMEPLDNIQNAMQCYVRAQAVADKVVADGVEALIGTYLLSGGVLGGVKILEWMRIIPPEDEFDKFLHKRVPTVLTEKKVPVSEVEFILNNFRTDVEQLLGYKFQDPSFLLEALTHPSYIRNRLTRSYERLEFLGDAILDFLITAHIFENCGNLKPGELTDLRSALVNNVTFASYVVKLGLHKYICSQLNPSLDNAIVKFVEHQEERGHEILEDVLYLIDEEDCQIAEYVEVPKVLSDVFESLVGAMFLDSGGDLRAVWAVVYRVVHREVAAFSQRIPLQPVRLLYETIHACPQFGKATVPATNVPKVMVPVTFTKNGRQCTAHGFGGNKSQAKRAAAKLALKILTV